ncbi:MAG: DUF2461 domain-containing protein [Bacteroidales bacterium]|nr:DUF2461 domain-containing protein [Bacteroidales bacterium]MBP5517493.1 DUF2461 domain-containing protein [Bacteroidales bacterium]
MKRVYDFLFHLSRNNNKPWFDAHKDQYLQAKKVFDEFTSELIDRIAKWDEYLAAAKPSVKDSTYRIYRDIRFSKDKRPYKTYMGAFVVPGGKKSPYCGYYFHLEPPQKTGLIGQCMLYVGIYQPDPKIMASFRDEVSVNGDSFLETVAKAKGFYLVDDCYRKVPAGFEGVENEEWKQLLRLKEVNLTRPMDKDFLFSGNLAEKVASRLKKCKDFSAFLNRCVEYALEGNL